MIAAANPTDAMTLSAIHARSFDHCWSAAECAALLEQPATIALMAPAGAPVGFIMISVASSESEVLTLAVVPGARRKGVGEALVVAAAGVATARGAETMYLEAAESNAAARALYTKLGFAEVGVRPGYYSGGENAVVMCRALPL
jgi:ribosomal-protein-alanine N-acetyltransferase